MFTQGQILKFKGPDEVDQPSSGYKYSYANNSFMRDRYETRFEYIGDYNSYPREDGLTWYIRVKKVGHPSIYTYHRECFASLVEDTFEADGIE